MDWVSFKVPVAEGATQGVPLPVAEAIVRVSVGDVTWAPVAVGNAREIVRLDQKRPTQVRPFAEVREFIRHQLEAEALQKAANAFIASEVKGASIQR
ncbi:peptidylprolyl isomerase [Burkholderia pyrrocinia]|uniref:peptidylprolyl isomerase n=1 Tax=Burkholderia pyrrocinia TaxID=60550 RepID=UPI001ABBC947|nr:peptidylprolyl isomerase [Burkholderia pyrrocinia]